MMVMARRAMKLRMMATTTTMATSGDDVNKQTHSLNFGGNWPKPKSYSTTHWMFLRYYHQLRWLLDGVAMQFMLLQREGGRRESGIRPPTAFNL